MVSFLRRSYGGPPEDSHSSLWKISVWEELALESEGMKGEEGGKREEERGRGEQRRQRELDGRGREDAGLKDD